MKKVEFDWKPKLRRNITTVDILVLTISITIILIIRFSDILKGPLTNYEIRNIVLALLVLFTWIFFLWFICSWDINILGFGADEYKRLINASLLSFTSVA